MLTTCFRHSNYRTPVRVIPSSREGRYNRLGDDATQYLSDHPLGTWAEFLRWSPTTTATVDTVAVRLWALRVDLADLVEVTFANASTFGLSPERLVSDDYSDCQDLADSLRSGGKRGLIAPSAALPGTRNVVLFGRYTLKPYSDEIVTPHQIAGTMLAGHARPPAEVAAMVHLRGFGGVHAELAAHLAGNPFVLAEPTSFADV